MRRLLLCLLASGLPIACSSAPPDKGSKAVQSERWATPSNTMLTFIVSTTSFTAASSLLPKIAKPSLSWAFKA